MDFSQLSIARLISAVRGISIKFGDKGEYDQPYSAIDFTDDQIPNKRAVLAWIGAQAGSDPLSIPSGSPYPMVVDMTTVEFANVPPNFIAQAELLNDVFDLATEATPIWDVKVTKQYADDTRLSLSTITIWAHPNDTLDATIDELQLIMR